MIEKLFGLMKISECAFNMSQLKNNYEEHINELQIYIKEIENKCKELESDKHNLSGKVKVLEMELLNKDKKINYYKKALKDREFMSLDNKIAWNLANTLKEKA